jgi:hypothetical protein
VLWWLLAPRFRFEVRDGGLYAAAGNPADWFGRDGWFIVCGAVLGLGAGVVVHRLWRRRPVVAVFGLFLGGLLASVLGLQVGRLLGPPRLPASVGGIASGTYFTSPLDLLAPAALLSVSFAAVFVFGLAVALESDQTQSDQPDEGLAGTTDPALAK